MRTNLEAIPREALPVQQQEAQTSCLEEFLQARDGFS